MFIFCFLFFVFLYRGGSIERLMPICLIKWSILRRENLVDNSATAPCYR
ncbi:hypothetical protein PPEP_a1773 [Pseudoalteromonas peptidolytica F12-50-A1]|uniref:Uncharacterized protein n=1 Tax=Pseudoalteromonas peptidolytica F12-50-A1 TaxID=1315280 RepID=A0A8I0MYG5_9GAMM|nr:hypothetical protein [Pseudoalteromonas peptidolytica F12-50-A1]